MKTKWIALGLMLVGMSGLGVALAEDEGPSVIDVKDNAALEKSVDKRAVVTGKIVKAAWSKSGKVMQINFDGTDHFAALVFERNRKKFDESFGGDASKTLTGAEVRITGKIEKYGGKDKAMEDTLQMVLAQTSQVTITSAATSQPAGDAPTTQQGN